MKFILTESKLESTIFKYLDNQDFVKIEGVEVVYFANSSDDKYAQIKFDKNDGLCFINFDLVKEISSFFSLQIPDSKKVISKWVENTLQMKVTYTRFLHWERTIFVENTLQMKVTYTATDTPFHFPQLRIPK